MTNNSTKNAGRFEIRPAGRGWCVVVDLGQWDLETRQPKVLTSPISLENAENAKAMYERSAVTQWKPWPCYGL